MQIRINSIIPRSVVDGPGVRCVLFVQGCTLACPGCQSKKLWPASGGYVTEVKDLAMTLATLSASIDGKVSLSGGEIFQQPAALAELVTELKALGVKHIIAYTGYKWEQLLDIYHPAYPWMKEILERIDVLIDGPFIRELDSDFSVYRGSTNQRPIDVAESLDMGEVVTLDWDSPEIVISRDGDIILPVGLARQLEEIGEVHNTAMCGQVIRS